MNDNIEENMKQVDPFVPTQPVWLLDANPVESDKIRASISPKVINFNNFDDLPNTLSARFNGDPNAFGTLIISNNLPEAFDVNFKTVVGALNNDDINKRLFIYHITDQGASPFKNATICKNIDDFIELANNVHIDSIASDNVVDEEARKIIFQLKVQNAKLTKNNDSLKEQIKDKNKKFEDLSESFDQVKITIERYENDKKNAEDKRKVAEDNLDKIKRNNEVLNKTIDKLRDDNYKANNENLELQTKISGLNQHIEDLNVKNNQLTQENFDLNNDLNKEKQNSMNYLETKTELAGMSQLKDQLDAATQMVRSEKSEKERYKAKNSTLEEKIKELEDTIDRLRHSDSYSNELGYDDPEVYQVIKLKNTKVIYFKIIDPIEFHRFYIEFFASKLRELMNNKDIITLMIKIDNGKDQERFSDRTFIGTMDAITNSTNKYSLIPSRRMAEGAYDFEKDNNKILIVMDYIDNSKYYVETENVYDHFVIANHTKDIKNIYELDGKPITHDRNSIVDWQFDRRVHMQTEKNKNEYFFKAVTPLFSESHVVLSEANNVNV